ncbi:MAG: aspartate carbamoyltransferase [Nanobdellota archaeon]
MAESNVFEGRTIAKSSDLSYDERFYLFEKTKKLKEAFFSGDSVDMFKLSDEIGVCLCFFEPSTRTKESFKNAALFIRSKLSNLDIETSSLTKRESYNNTIKTLAGYNNRIFIVRSGVEGLCTWLEESVSNFAQSHGFKRPCFVNGGDGKHEHPTQEELDEFTFLEQMQWDNSFIHIALVGDLFHGRTVHSKVSGLKNFSSVKVDLVAPDILQMPKNYLEIMKHQGFSVRLFSSLDEYYNSSDIAPIQYFTRLQLERMGDEIKQEEKALRDAVTFREEFIKMVPENTKLYHPQPFDKANPTIPLSIAETSLNGYDNQSINGYFWRIVLLNALSGNIGRDFKGKSKSDNDFKEDFVEKINPKIKAKKEPRVGIRPISKGIVIDHICKGEVAEKIWKHLHLVLKVVNLQGVGFCGVGKSGDSEMKGIIVLPDRERPDEKVLKRLAAVCPDCSLNVIQEDKVAEKYRLHMPPRIYGFEEIRCKNPNCISREEFLEGVVPEFHAISNQFICKFCDTSHSFKEIWKGYGV